jgi:hypothetical protein
LIGLLDGMTNHHIDRVAMLAPYLVLVPVAVLEALAHAIEERYGRGPSRRRKGVSA